MHKKQFSYQRYEKLHCCSLGWVNEQQDFICTFFLVILLCQETEIKSPKVSEASSILIPFGKFRPNATLEKSSLAYWHSSFQWTRKMLFWHDAMPVMISKVKTGELLSVASTKQIYRTREDRVKSNATCCSCQVTRYPMCTAC